MRMAIESMKASQNRDASNCLEKTDRFWPILLKITDRVLSFLRSVLSQTGAFPELFTKWCGLGLTDVRPEDPSTTCVERIAVDQAYSALMACHGSENDMSAIKKSLGVPRGLASCHTAVIDGKFVEGHVPAEEIKKLSARSDLVGIAVPGMPAGSPGMEYGQNYQPYKVIGFTRAGVQEVVATYPISR